MIDPVIHSVFNDISLYDSTYFGPSSECSQQYKETEVFLLIVLSFLYDLLGMTENCLTLSECCLSDVTTLPSDRSHSPTLLSADALANTVLQTINNDSMCEGNLSIYLFVFYATFKNISLIGQQPALRWEEARQCPEEMHDHIQDDNTVILKIFNLFNQFEPLFSVKFIHENEGKTDLYTRKMQICANYFISLHSSLGML